MEQDQSVSTRRFIFSDDFYDNLDSNAPQEKEVSFDVPQMPSKIELPKEEPKEEIVENKETSLSSDFLFNNSVNDNVEEVKIKKKEEPILPSFEFNKVEEEPSFNIPAIQENKQEEVSVPVKDEVSYEPEFQPIPSFVSNPVENINNFNVESGINTELEKEIMKSKIENEFKNPIVTNNNWFGSEKGEKVVYRARRNNPSMMNVNNQKEIKEEPVVLAPILSTSNVGKSFITEKDINPDVINIDELLAKEIEDEEPFTIQEDEIVEDVDVNVPVIKSDLLEELRLKEQQTGKVSILARYGDDFCSRDYITNPAIGRNEEIKQLILILLTPEKSGILVGKPGIGKTSIVEGLAYRLQRNQVPDVLKGYRIVSVKTTSLLGTLPTGEARLQTLIDELKDLDKIILFIDEVHMLMGATSESSLDFANMFKESLGRGSIKMIGATTNDEYERYVLRDKAFVRRFQRVDVEEPTREQTIKILMGTLPKIEKNTGAKLKYTSFIKTEIMSFIVDITTEYKRVYGIGSRYPDICLTLLAQAFSQAVFDNRKEVNILDIREAIENSKNIYPDVIRKELVNFDNKFKQIINEEKAI